MAHGSVFVLGAGCRGFEHRPGQGKDCKIDIWVFSAKPSALTSKNKD